VGATRRRNGSRPRGRRGRPAGDVWSTRRRRIDGLLTVHLRTPAPAPLRGLPPA
jgi:hypothetical protein